MSLYTEKTQITHDEYLKLEGLLVIGPEYEKQVDQVIRSIALILGEQPPDGERPGHAADAVYGGYTARELLRKSDITVLPPEEIPG